MANLNSYTPNRSNLSTISIWGIFAVGGYLLWNNRFAVQRFLESYGINTPWMKGNLSDAVRSGVAKISGSVEHEVRPAEREVRSMTRGTGTTGGSSAAV